MVVPLDKIKISVVNQRTDELEEIPVLHSSLCRHSAFGLLYQKIFCESENDVEHSCSMLNELLFNLHWLLSLPYEKFWCQVVNDKSVHACLDSYLRIAPRYRQSDWPQELQEKHSHVHRAVFMIFLRMSTLKESKEHLMSQKLFANLVYDNYLFDIPRIMDLCTLYNVPDNQPLLKKMISSLFNNQPKFFDDLRMAAQTVSKIISQIKEKCFGSPDVETKPSKLLNGQNKSLLYSMPDSELADLIYYISDTAKTLESFIVDIFTDAAQTFYEHELIDRLLMLYSDVLPEIRKILAERERTLGFAVHFQLRCHVRQSCDSMMKIINGMVQTCVYLPTIESAEQENHEKTEVFAEKYFEILSSFLSNPKFFNDFCNRFSTRQDVQNLNKICPNIAEAHSSFLFTDTNDLASSTLQANPASNITDDVHPGNDFNHYSNDRPSTSTDASAGRSSIEEVKMTSSVTSILDVLPDLEVDFVKQCLSYYEMNPEKVIQAIFEDNLPPHLTTAKSDHDPTKQDQSSGNQKNKSENSSSKNHGSSSSKNVDLLSGRRNIFDNDEFDVFAKGNKMDMSRVYYGKRDADGEISHWSKGESGDVEKLRLLYNKYGLGAEDTDNDDFLGHANSISNYDDEYDDTYDDADIGANDADSVDELGDEEEEDVAEEKPRFKFGKPDFVENPEVVRAREAERIRKREEYFASRGGRASKHSRNAQNRNSSETNRESSDKKKHHQSTRSKYSSEGKREYHEKRNNNSSEKSGEFSVKANEENSSANNGDHAPAENASGRKKVDRKKTEYKQTRGGHSRKMQTTRKAGKGMFMSR